MNFSTLGLSDVLVRATVGQPGAEDGMATQQREQLAGHHGGEAGDRTVAHVHPLAVRAWHQQPHVARGRWRLRQQADDRGFFATHHVRSGRIAQARHDVHGASVGCFH